LSVRGKLLNFIPIPNDEVTNCAFGGGDWKTLFITAGGHLWSIRLDASGRVP
jgi:gluconolactonase